MIVQPVVAFIFIFIDSFSAIDCNTKYNFKNHIIHNMQFGMRWYVLFHAAVGILRWAYHISMISASIFTLIMTFCSSRSNSLMTVALSLTTIQYVCFSGEPVVVLSIQTYYTHYTHQSHIRTMSLIRIHSICVCALSLPYAAWAPNESIFRSIDHIACALCSVLVCGNLKPQ